MMNHTKGLSDLKSLYLLLIMCCCIFCTPASAQLVANFTADKEGGCSPLSVKFTNTSTGATATTTWQWNFGNGNSSTLKDPGATYFTEKTYTVTLTAKDGTASSVKTITITVYKKPTVDFAVTPIKGCAPLAVNFTANAQAGDGTIANYLWDFGDGANVQGANYATTQHTYTFPQVPPITLNVTNSFGCYSTITKNNQVEVVTGVQAIFTPSTTTVCNAGESVTFSNTSTGSGTLTYAWDFGDGKTSTEKSPVHAYASSGNFIAKLTTTSSDGCSATMQSATINVANFKADFEVQALICLNQQIVFSNKSTNPFDKAEWYVDNSNYSSYSNYTDGSFFYYFNTPGEHTVKLIMYYGGCTASVTKTYIVNGLPKLDGFVVDLQGACGVPLTINYKDTSSNAVSWKWQNSYFGNTFATTKNAAYTYTSGSSEYVYLTVTNAAGCSATAGKYVNYDKPNVYITLTNSTVNQGCKPVIINFAAFPDTTVATYKWNFGDGTAISTESKPRHIFNTDGIFVITLDYTTPTGCTGTAYYNSITVVDKPVFDFKSSQTTICGNTPDTLTATPFASGWNFFWSFNEEYGYYYGSSTIVKQFTYDTTYTVKMIASKFGCTDTVIKTNYLKVLPPFPRIQQVFNTCDGKRGDVRFTETSQKALKWSWDFGDGGTDTYTSFKDTILHTYAATNKYKVVLSATNGGCTVRDSTTAYVLLKQKPSLSSTKTDACASTTVDIRLYNFEKSPAPYFYYNYGYGVQYKEYNDSTACNASLSSQTPYIDQELNGYLDQLEPSKTSLRMITTSFFFGCADTTNFLPLKIRGPKAGYKQELHSGCFKDPVRFTDTSSYLGTVRIVKWDWDFGDGTTQTLTSTGSVSHTYSRPGTFYINLKVTDADGCFNSINTYNRYVTVSGPKADFVASAYTVPPNTLVNFTNTSADYYYYYGAGLQWRIHDSTFSTDNFSASLNFIQDGVYPVQLITKNTATGCTDTMVKNITVRKVNSAFRYALSYINNNACPPVIATFTSISTNAVRLSWDFGDGGIGGNSRIVTHTYNKPGIYRVVHYSYDSNIGVDSTEDFIEVKGPYALLKADQLTGCSNLQVKLTADVKYASNYTWDFGDGTVVPTTDTFAVHNYVTPGIYVPALILKDAGGCTATSELPEKVIVDSLLGRFKLSPAIICDSAISIFTATAYSLSFDQLQIPIQYKWVVKEGLTTDTLYNETASKLFNKLGVHPVQLTISTPYCQQTITDSVIVKQGVAATISAANKICRTDTLGFTANAIPAGAAYTWKWDFKNGNVSTLQNPLPQQYSTAGPQQISLIVSNGFCADTAYHTLLVNALPVVGILPANPFVCKGSTIAITASGGIAYQWTANTAIANANAASININPTASTNYTVKVTDANNCSSKDSINVKVIAPMIVTASNSLFACQGKAVQLAVSGADKYKWIGNTRGISDTTIANPSALTNASVTYTVVGYDNYNCFADTTTVAVRISPLPVVNAGTGKQLISGASFTMTPVVSGAVNYLWSPSDYLSCINCLNPVSTPKSSIIYTVTAFNNDGCQASDTIQLQLACASSLVFIPNAFSPNNDNVNDRFTITGSGIKVIQSIVVYSRYGKIIFERKNIAINDRNNSWDGTINGEPASPGAYVYSIQAVCESGEVFDFKGTVMVVR
jgi:gliding motility-associated-like protein